MAYIEFKNVDKIYPMGETKLKALDKASFEAEKGELVVILGQSGSGKSTCLNILGGMDSATSGNVIIDGKDITKLKEKDLINFRRNDIGFVFQFYNLVQNLTVEENIMLPVIMEGLKRKDFEKQLNEILEIVGLTSKRKSLPNELSGGQQQRVAIARAVILNPKIILADEATGNLDSKSGKDIMELFKRINKEKNITILQVTHSEETAKYGDRIIYLKDGKIV